MPKTQPKKHKEAYAQALIAESGKYLRVYQLHAAIGKRMGVSGAAVQATFYRFGWKNGPALRKPGIEQCRKCGNKIPERTRHTENSDLCGTCYRRATAV